jgi:hypothetical protein
MYQFAWSAIVVAEVSAMIANGLRLKILSFKYSPTLNLCEAKICLQSLANRRSGRAKGESFTDGLQKSHVIISSAHLRVN